MGSLCLECSAADWKIKNLSNAEKSAWAGCPTTLKKLLWNSICDSLYEKGPLHAKQNF